MAEKLSEREVVCLRYLEHKMEARALMIGVAIVDAMRGRGGSNYSAVAANVVGRLQRRGLVSYLPDLHAWRISAAGRTALASQELDKP